MALTDSLITSTTPAPPKMIVYGQPGIGKAQPMDAAVLTPTGFVPMGNIQVGGQVIGADGRPHQVFGVYPQGPKEVFRVTFRDGSQTECTGDHLWLTQTLTERQQGLAGSVRPLSAIRSTLRYGTRFNHAVRRVEPVHFARTTAPLRLHPWLMGMYLGDGHADSSVIITNPETDVQEKIKSLLPEGDKCVLFDKINLRISGSQHGKPSAFMAALREMGLDQHKAEGKFVPQQYLLASLKDRLELLRGLVDSDGFVAKNGAVEFTTVSRQLAHDVCFLIRSLGGSARMVSKNTTYTYRGEKRNGQLAYRIYASFTNGVVPVASEKHGSKWQKPEWAIRHSIRKIEPVGVKECQCIKIDALDALYVTDDFIVTHNTTFAASAGAVLIDCENGAGAVPGLKRTPYLQSWPQMRQWLVEIATTPPEDMAALAIDTIDWMVQRIVEHVVLDLDGKSAGDITNTLGTAHGGYFKAREIVQNIVYRDLLPMLNTVADNGVAIILLAHAANTRMTTPEGFDLRLAGPDLPHWIAPPFIEWADAVLYAARDGDKRTLLTEGTNVVLAKNRYSLPAELPLSWPALMAAMSDTHTHTEKETTHG